MTKMNMPEIKVVRFNESDVIVASGSFTLTGMGNVAPDGTFGFGGKEYSVANSETRQPFYDAFYASTNIQIGDTTRVHYNNGETTTQGTLSSAMNYDTYGADYIPYNGVYTWDGIDSFRYSGKAQ